uniref:Uncharacterized protein n=1 Tax=Arundo donax TaxID=35708 RepID=A0A0A9GPD8_ARUDO
MAFTLMHWKFSDTCSVPVMEKQSLGHFLIIAAQFNQVAQPLLVSSRC